MQHSWILPRNRQRFWLNLCMTALSLVIVICAVITSLCWLLSLITHEHSWVDRIWSIAPIIYLWVFAGKADFHNVRLNVMALLVTAWGLRLTFNFARKGGYSGMEDYRWEVLRNSMKKWQFALFNIFFISIYQNILIMLIALPAWNAYQHQGKKFGPWDLFFSIGFIALLIGETVADQQQWNFQQEKKAMKEAGITPKVNFLQTGSFKYSRHPNYFYEQAQWWVLFFIGAVSAGSILQWTLVGPVLLTILFVGSTNFTEKLSLAKYPEYADYQKSTSAVIPFFNKKRSV